MAELRMFSMAVFLAMLVASICMTNGCRKRAESGGEDVAMSQTIVGKKVVMVIAARDFRDEELFETRKVLESAGANIMLACASLEQIKGMLGGSARADVLLKNVSAADFDAIVFVGGSGAAQYWDDPTAQNLARDGVKSGKVVAAICIAPVTLARAGLLKGRKATVWKSQSGDLTKCGATYTGAPVETDGQIVTADGPSSATAFGKALVKAISN
ncbi:MAG TPA: DJ-1/PfpI family protein [Candidatus Brocadiia bacterium]|nr:DJ-1/PfpI family protein [Candidatus Brocadiia bacterium]